MLDNPQPKPVEPAPAADNSSAPKPGQEQKQVADVAL
jgi:malate dehydrogenase (quinone)